VVDDGLSRNGSFLNEDRLSGRRRLRDGDVVRVGNTALVFRAPIAEGASTAVAGAGPAVAVSAAERRVLIELCRPLLVEAGAGVPASNTDIAAALHLSQAGVKFHIRALFSKLDVDDLPQYGKRTALAQRAISAGLVTARNL
jgi:DNA-binding CsgD family transcriptional regulator